jgi:outer membrane protein assembly factor BamB
VARSSIRAAAPVAALLCAAALTAAAQAARKPRSPAPPPTPAPTPTPESWTVWGGLRHDFTSRSTGLAESWPKDGPPRVWTRALGDGYSAIAEENGVLYTAFRRGDKDVVVALDAASGKTIWEHEYEAAFRNAYPEAVGPGPYAMPQVVGDRVVSASGTGKIHSLDKRTGKPAWSHDLYDEFGGTRLAFGYSCHGLPYKDTLIYLAGGSAPFFGFGRGSAVVAFRQGDGAVAWKDQSFKNAHSSPLLIDVGGQLQVVALVADRVIGFSPDTGALLWSHPHATQNGLAISTPVWSDGILFVASAYSGGARGLQLARSGDTTTVTELWHNPRLQLHFGNAIRVGDHVYLSAGHSGPAFMTAAELKTGRIAWQTRDFSKAQLIHADGKLIVLDEDGTLALGRATPQRFEVLARVPLLKRLAWTPPTLVGTRLYVRDRQTISALELGATASR